MSAAGQQNQPEPGILLFMIGFLVFGMLWLIWHFFKEPLLDGMRWLRYGELWIVSVFTDKQDACLHWLKSVRFGDAAPSPRVIEYTQGCFGLAYLGAQGEGAADYFQLSATSMAAVERIVTLYDRWILVAGLGAFGIYISFFSPRNKFRTRHSLETFIQTQAKMWPIIAPIAKFDPGKTSARRLGDKIPDKLPPFAEALSPEEWISYHRITVTNGIPDREAARRAFLLQLGPRWTGLDGTPLHVQALIAAFALKGAQKREESDDLLGRLSLCWSVGAGLSLPGDLLNEIRGYNRDAKLIEPVLEVAREHAYRVTAVLGILRWARMQGGVTAPAQFLWLRAVDRVLWYALNNLGRRSFHTEGAGALAHFMAERNAKKALPIPRIDTAIVTLNQYFASSGQPIPPRE
ncbi:MAG: hypothetical protein M3N08_00845 [Pseudomonadota bacterium]|nr:hypothetical protein [Pseudomonadota bacterium]